MLPTERGAVKLDEAFWASHANLSAGELHRTYPNRFANDANWRKAKRKAKAKMPHLFESTTICPPAVPQNIRHRVYHEPVTEMMLGFCGDTHGGSAEERNEELHTFYDLCQEAGVTDVLHTGDITAGIKVFPGQEYEIAEHGFERQVGGVVRRYPRRAGITTHFVTGNHDYSFFKHGGVDVGKAIAAERDDMRYLGRYGATVELSPGFTVYVLHMDGGVPYALSYRRQRIVEGFIGGTKPRIFISGHDHQHVYFDYRNVEVFGTGCFEGQSDFLRRKGIEPHIGGWIVNVKLDGNGAVRRITPEWVKFYEGY